MGMVMGQAGLRDLWWDFPGISQKPHEPAEETLAVFCAAAHGENLQKGVWLPAAPLFGDSSWKLSGAAFPRAAQGCREELCQG